MDEKVVVWKVRWTDVACDHIVGLTREFYDEPSHLWRSSNDIYLGVDIDFKYCPLCGEDIWSADHEDESGSQSG